SAALCSTAPPSTEVYTLSLHDALPICAAEAAGRRVANPSRLDRGHAVDRRARDGERRGINCIARIAVAVVARHIDEHGRALSGRSEEHTSELQSRENLVCRLLLEKKKK